jgi:hypothetical protein
MPSPNVLLEELRDMAELDDFGFPVCEEEDDDAAEKLERALDRFAQLDKHLSEGGDLPRAWVEAKKP